jgi:hypothetical protein
MMGVVMALCERHDYFIAIDASTAQQLSSGIKLETKSNGVVKREGVDSTLNTMSLAPSQSYGSAFQGSINLSMSQSSLPAGLGSSSSALAFDGRADSSLLGTAAYPLTVDERNSDSLDNQRFVWKLYHNYLKEVVVRIQQFTGTVPHSFFSIHIVNGISLMHENR